MYVVLNAVLKELPCGGRVNSGAFGAVRLCALTVSIIFFSLSVNWVFTAIDKSY